MRGRQEPDPIFESHDGPWAKSLMPKAVEPRTKCYRCAAQVYACISWKFFKTFVQFCRGYSIWKNVKTFFQKVWKSLKHSFEVFSKSKKHSFESLKHSFRKSERMLKHSFRLNRYPWHNCMSIILLGISCHSNRSAEIFTKRWTPLNSPYVKGFGSFNNLHLNAGELYSEYLCKHEEAASFSRKFTNFQTIW